jgi:hypothetical protein
MIRKGDVREGQGKWRNIICKNFVGNLFLSSLHFHVNVYDYS